MTGRRIQHLERRGAVYYVRLPVPLALHAALGRKELRWSLRTKEICEAQQRAARVTLAFRRLCDSVGGMTQINQHQIRAAIGLHYRHTMRHAASLSPPVWNDDGQQREFSIECYGQFITALRHVVENNAFDAPSEEDWIVNAANAIRTSAVTAAQEGQISIEGLSPGHRAMLLQGAGRVLIEENCFERRRLDGRREREKDPVFPL